jgi:hypothetical protein
METISRYLLAIGLCLCESTSFAHPRSVHFTITSHASDSALDGSAGYAGFVNGIAPDCDLTTAANVMAWGSWWEDNRNEDNGGIRSLNHFYDPLTGLGLSNVPYEDRLIDPATGQFRTIGRDLFTWASTRDCPGIDVHILGIGINVDTRNIWSWQNARDYQLAGLTAETRVARQQALQDMFRAVGHVVHLLEDASQPEHTRNEQHLCPPSRIEQYGDRLVDGLNYQPGLLDWRGFGFTRMRDFWDRDLYDGSSAQALVNDADPWEPERLGLAEFSNGNFLGGRHLYPEYFTPGSVQYYPFPSRTTSTDYEQVRANPALGLHTFRLENGREVRGIYITKVADGVRDYFLSRINYLGARRFRGLAGPAFCTINDPVVLRDYHNWMIPKAIEYSAGILDYFFRGRLEVEVCQRPDGIICLQVANRSGQALRGGLFVLLAETTGGDRTPVAPLTPAWQVEETLADNASRAFEFRAPTPPPSRYVLVYQGTIGIGWASQALDEVDAGIAVAAVHFDPPAQDCGCGLHYQTNHAAIPRLVNTTLVSPDPCTGNPVPPATRPWVAVPECEGGSPVGPFPEPVPANTYGSPGPGQPTHLDFSQCEKRGFKRVYARKSWHGAAPFNSSTHTPRYESFAMSGGIPVGTQIPTPYPAESTRYLRRTMHVGVQITGTYEPPEDPGASYEDPFTERSGVGEVDRYSGKPSGSYSPESTTPAIWSDRANAVWAETAGAHNQTAFAKLMHIADLWENWALSPSNLGYLGADPVDYTITGEQALASQTFVHEYFTPSPPWDEAYEYTKYKITWTLDAECTIDGASFEGSMQKKEESWFYHRESLEDPFDEGIYASMEWSEGGTLTLNATEVVITSYMNYPGMGYEVTGTGTLSVPYTSADVQADIAALLDLWNLADDVQFPWENDSSAPWSYGPLVCRNERGPAAPGSWPAPIPDPANPGQYIQQQDNTPPPFPSFADGAVIGAPRAIGTDPFFDFYHLGWYQEVGGCLRVSTIGHWVPHAQDLEHPEPLVHATKWLDRMEADSIEQTLAEPAAMVNLNRIDHINSECVNAPDYLNGLVAWACKHAEIIQPDRKSWNFFRPCGADRARFPDAWPICGRIAVALATQNGGGVDIILAETAEHLITGDQVDFSGVGGLGEGMSVTVVDATHFSVAGTLSGSYAGGGFVKSHGAPDHWWNDDSPKGDYVTLEQVVNHHLSPVTAEETCTQRQVVRSACCPATVAYSPNGEFGAANTFWPEITLDYVNGRQWKGRIHQFMRDTITGGEPPPQVEARCAKPVGAPDVPPPEVIGLWPWFDREGGEDALWP